MKPGKKTPPPKSAARPAPKATKAGSAFRLTPAEREVEAIRERRRKLWRELGSVEAVEALGRKVLAQRQALKKAHRKRSA